jgi:hypothetical protein
MINDSGQSSNCIYFDILIKQYCKAKNKIEGQVKNIPDNAVRAVSGFMKVHDRHWTEEQSETAIENAVDSTARTERMPHPDARRYVVNGILGSEGPKSIF